MKTGLEVFLSKYTEAYQDKRLGLLTNSTGVNHELVSSIDLFAEHETLTLTALYGPEHGIRGDAQEGEWISSSIDPYTNLPVYSLYHENKNPDKEMLENVDVVFCDLQDIGSRYYTFIYTMANMMRLCKKEGKRFVVLDRPNPINGEDVEGNLVQAHCTSFVGQYPIPVRHGLTIGELAHLFNEEFDIHCELKVIEMEGWSRRQYFDDTNLHWVSPTPNATNINMCLLYPGTCLIEGLNVSEGRGTTKPFEIIGAPFINGRKLAEKLTELELPGVTFRPTTFQPMYQKFAGEVCGGVQIHIIDRKVMKPVQMGVLLLQTLVELYPNQVEFIRSQDFNNRFFLDLLIGTDALRKQLMTHDTNHFIAEMEKERQQFMAVREKYLRY